MRGIPNVWSEMNALADMGSQLLESEYVVVTPCTCRELVYRYIQGVGGVLVEHQPYPSVGVGEVYGGERLADGYLAVPAYCNAEHFEAEVNAGIDFEYIGGILEAGVGCRVEAGPVGEGGEAVARQSL